MDCTTEIAAGHVKSLYALLTQVPNYRARRRRRYEPVTELAIVLLAKLAGESTLSGIAHWAQLREAWLKTTLGLTRLPCANTYHYICVDLDVGELTAAAQRWLAQVAPQRQGDGCRAAPCRQSPTGHSA